jgi:inner membrane protein involved in colicin E2 resistance
VYQRIVIIDVMWVALGLGAWYIGLLDAFSQYTRPDLIVLGFLLTVFIAGQVAVIRGNLDLAHWIAQMLVQLALVCFVLTMANLGVHADFTTAAGKNAVIKAVFLAIAINATGVATKSCLESLIRSLEDAGYETEEV